MVFSAHVLANFMYSCYITKPFLCPLCYNSKARCYPVQCLHTKSVILVGAYAYFISSIKFEGKNNCYDLIPNPRKINI